MLFDTHSFLQATAYNLILHVSNTTMNPVFCHTSRCLLQHVSSGFSYFLLDYCCENEGGGEYRSGMGEMRKKDKLANCELMIGRHEEAVC